MKKILQMIFIGLCIALCLIPSLGMVVYRNHAGIGNETQATMPALLDDGKPNREYLPQLGTYFEKNFAFRAQAITADNSLMSTLFGVSDTSGVLSGKNGWLYYAATLDDYLGRNTLSEAQMQALVQNLEIIQGYAAQNGSEFLLTVAPNKNTLYPENMPYYYMPDKTAERNRDLLAEALGDSDINYCNLFELFSGQTETLYLKTDSHWDNSGALLAYNAMLEKLGKVHEDFSSAPITRKKVFRGDLAKMLYPASEACEYNAYYGEEQLFSYVTDTKSTEEPLIKTKSDATGSLYMYRDSFGNALVPFIATAFRNATFTKSFPMMLENDVTPGSQDTVIFEIAERNINWFLKMPPVVSAPEITVFETETGKKTDTSLQMKTSEYSPLYIEISGKLEYDVRGDSPVYLKIEKESGEVKTLRCFNTLSDEGENGFLAYLKSEDFGDGEKLDIRVLIEKENTFYEIDNTTLWRNK